MKLVAMAGCQSLGMEMSPSIISKAREWFGVDMIRGPIEHADRPVGSYDVILLFDVIEHFAHPIETMGVVLEHVADDGVVVIQTPIYGVVTSAEWRQFKPPDHTLLFSREGLRLFFRRMGFDHVAEEAALFQDDQFVFASRRPLTTNTPNAISERLASTPDGRIVLAMQEMYRDSRALHYDLERFGPRTLGKSFVRALMRKVRLR